MHPIKWIMLVVITSISSVFIKHTTHVISMTHWSLSEHLKPRTCITKIAFNSLNTFHSVLCARKRKELLSIQQKWSITGEVWEYCFLTQLKCMKSFCISESHIKLSASLSSHWWNVISWIRAVERDESDYIKP